MSCRKFLLGAVLIFELILLPISTLAANKEAIFYAMTFNIANFVQWKPNAIRDQTDSFNICEYKRKFKPLNLIALENRYAKSLPVVTYSLTSDDTLEQCHILLISKETGPSWLSMVQVAEKKNILTISMKTGFAQYGGGIELYLKNNKLKFRVNVDVISRSGIQISSKILELSDIVKD